MNRRVLLIGFLLVVCLTTLWGVWAQRNQLADLRAEQQQLLAQQASNSPASLTTADAEAALSGTPPPTLVVTPELLRLRSEVTRLTERRRELEGVRADNERLLAQLASRPTNGPGGFQVPPGYVRRSEARMVGYNTPEDTLQTFLWALQSRDPTNVLQALAPDAADMLHERLGATPESAQAFQKDTALILGARVVKREENASDGSVGLEIEIIPGVSGPQIGFRQINGQWKIGGMPF